MVRNIDALGAWKILSEVKHSALIDVRTAEEWKFTGVPDLKSLGEKMVLISWQLYPDMSINGNFLEKMQNLFPNKQTSLLYLCRSGFRSFEAASSMYNNGYLASYNISDGFEGNLDNQSHRNSTSGWKWSNLPWRQS